MPAPAGLLDHEPAAESLDAVGETAQARAVALVGAADAVVDDLDVCAVVGALDATRASGARAYLATLVSASADDEVGRGLDGLGQALVERNVDRDGQRRGVGDRLDRRAQAVVGEHGGMHARAPARAAPPARGAISSPAPSSMARRAGSAVTRRAAMRTVSEVATSRCWAPSCRLRSRRRRSASLASRMRMRDAASSSRAWALAIAWAARSAKSATRNSASGGNGTP